MRRLLTFTEFSAKIAPEVIDVTTGTKSPIATPSSPPSSKLEYYTDYLLKLIPSEIIGAYVVIDGIIQGSNVDISIIETVQWLVVGILFILTPLYLYFLSKVNNVKHLVLATIGFLVWVFALGGPFENLGDKSLIHLIGSITLVLFSLFVMIFANQIAKNDQNSKL